jgi:hypothetical protein
VPGASCANIEVLGVWVGADAEVDVFSVAVPITLLVILFMGLGFYMRGRLTSTSESTPTPDPPARESYRGRNSAFPLRSVAGRHLQDNRRGNAPVKPRERVSCSSL